MRVLLVHNFYQIPGGEDRVVREELSLLAKHGVDVDLFSVSNEEIRGISGRIAGSHSDSLQSTGAIIKKDHRVFAGCRSYP